MKSQLSSFDIAALIREFQQCIGLRIEKIFLLGYDDLFIRFTGIKQKKTISIKLGQSMWLDEGFRTSKSVEPPTFAMLLRKYISGKEVKSITQHGFDRIVIFELQDNIRLIAELFGRGNLILVEENKIIQPLTSRSWRAREVKKGHDYVFPPESVNPFELGSEEISGILGDSKKDLVRCLAMELNLGGAYAEEICHSLARNKTDRAAELSEEEMSEVHEIIKYFYDMLAAPKPHIVFDSDGVQKDVLPFLLSMHGGLDRKYFETHSQALKEYFSNLPENAADQGPRKSQRQMQLERQLANQLEAMESLKIQIRESKETGDRIYANYGILNALLGTVNSMLEGGNWQAARADIVGLENVVDFDPAGGMLTVELARETIRLDVRLNLNDNASVFYEKSKKAKHKLEGAIVAAGETRKLLEGALRDHAEKQESGGKKPSKRFWFDRFRWFMSSQGHMVVAGRDARTNDLVVKKHLKDGDLYAHADMSGAPSVVIKGVSPEDSQTLLEACIFAISYSKAWKGSIASGSAYWVKPDQVSKTPQPGEFLARGAFVIRGKRNYSKKLDLRLALGRVLVQGAEKIMCGPETAVVALTSEYYIIEPGHEKSNSFSRKLSDEYNVPIEEIDRILPPGGIRVVQTPRKSMPPPAPGTA